MSFIGSIDVALPAIAMLLKSISRASTTHQPTDDRQTNAILQVWDAVDATRIFLSSVRLGEADANRPNPQLVKLWSKAAVAIADIDGDLADRLRMKAEYWSDPTTWNPSQIRKARIAIDEISTETRRLLGKKGVSKFNAKNTTSVKKPTTPNNSKAETRTVKLSQPEASDITPIPVAKLPIIVLITVNDNETHAVLDAFLGVGKSPNHRTLGGVTYNELGIHGGHLIIHTVCEMGAGGVGASQQRTRQAIEHWKPCAIIAVGIAFGLDETKQHIGDVLVSTQLQDYELSRLNADGSITPRGDKPSSADALRNRLRQTDTTQSRCQHTWPKVCFGLVLTGQKLVDNLDYRECLKSLFGEAVGGEMEGIGLYVSANEAKVDWIVVKAICDWGHNKNTAKKDSWQKLAAKNAAHVLKTALDVGSLYSSEQITEASDVLNATQQMEYDNDIKVCQKIFTEITSLRELDFFIERALYPYMLASVLEQYEEFENYLQSSNYHVFDNELSELIHNFHVAWSTVCQYWNAFTPTNTPNLLRLCNPSEADSKTIEIAREKVPKAAQVMFKSQKELLKYIRNTYKGIAL